MTQVPIWELAEVIRSKNAGPYELTFDIIFKDAETVSALSFLLAYIKYPWKK